MDNPVTPERLDHFQIIRGVACLMVVWSHVGGALMSSVQIKEFAWYLPIIFPAGFPWVWVFLTLSGFLLTKAFVSGRFELSTQGISAFYEGRAKRLFPLMWFASSLWLVLYSLGIWPKGWYAVRLWHEISVALAFPWVPYTSQDPISSANSPIWSAVIEVHFSVLLPLLLLLPGLSLARRLRLSAGSIISCLFGLWLVYMTALTAHVILYGAPTIFPNTYQRHAYNFGFFAAGMLIAFVPSRKRLEVVPWPVVLVLVAVAFYAANWLNFGGGPATLAIAPFLVLPAAALLVARANDSYQMPLPSTLGAFRGGYLPLRWLELVGVMSYSVYLLHRPLCFIAMEQTNMAAYVHDYVTCFTAGAAVILPLLVICAVTCVHIETRFRKAKWRLTRTVLP